MRKARWLGLKLFILFICLYLLTSGGRIVSSDGTTMYLLTRNIVEEQTVAIPYGNGYAGADGRLYPKAGIGQALLSAPFYVVGREVYGRSGFGESERGYVMRFATAAVEPFAAAVAVVLLLHICFCLGYGVKSSLALAMAFGFSGYLLPWNQLAFFATKVGTDIAGSFPVVGEWLLRFLRGGDRVTGGTLSRFYGWHVAILPLVTTVILGFHLVLVQVHGMSVPPSEEKKGRRLSHP